MNFPGSAPPAVAALDFFSGQARVILATRIPAGKSSPDNKTWRVLGAGAVALEGIEAGRITHLSDAVETVVAALSAAEKAAGRKAESLFYTFHDPAVLFRRFRASRTLPGEGQVRLVDVRAVFSLAERLAGSFETANIYSTGLGFVIDDQDPVADPVGVFGHKIEIETGFLQARSQTLASWKDVMRRANLPSSWAVSIPQAAVLGALGSDGSHEKRLVVFERAGETVVCRASGLVIETCETSATASFSVNGNASSITEIITVGDDAQALAERLGAQTGVPAHAAHPEGVSGLHSAQDALTTGLLAVAGEREKIQLITRHGQGLARKARRKLTAFWNDYF